jgi:hypothetical protein
MLRNTFSMSRSSALLSGCFRNTQVAHTCSNSVTACPLTASNGWNGPGVLPASNGNRLCHCLPTYLVFLSSEQCATLFFLAGFFLSDQTLHRVMGTHMLDRHFFNMEVQGTDWTGLCSTCMQLFRSFDFSVLNTRSCYQSTMIISYKFT